MSNTEKLINKLNEIKEVRKQKEKVLKPAQRIQQIKNNLIILAHDLFVSKKINAALYSKMQYLTLLRTSEKKLNASYEILKKLKNTVTKAEKLQGPTKIKKVTVKDFKGEVKQKKEVLKIDDNKNNQIIHSYAKNTVLIPSKLFASNNLTAPNIEDAIKQIKSSQDE